MKVLGEQVQLQWNKNNLFGHGAVDSNPYYGANGYANPKQV